MGNVWEAIKKRQAEQAAEHQAEGQTPDGDTPEAPEPRGAVATVATRPANAEAGARPAATNGKARYDEILVAHHEPGGMITEQFRALRTNLLAQSADERFCYLVTSADESEGKTATCMNLGLVMAERLERETVVVDFDLRKASLAGMIGAKRQPGTVDVLRGDATVDDVIQPTTQANLFVIPGGKASKTEVGEMFSRPELDEMVTELRRRYDYVIFDTPPITRIADAGVLGRSVGEALLIVRMNKTHRESVEQAVRLLHAANVNVAGVVLTHEKQFNRKYYYRYY